MNQNRDFPLPRPADLVAFRLTSQPILRTRRMSTSWAWRVQKAAADAAGPVSTSARPRNRLGLRSSSQLK